MEFEQLERKNALGKTCFLRTLAVAVVMILLHVLMGVQGWGSNTIEMTVPPFHSPMQDKDQVGSGEKVSWQFSS